MVARVTAALHNSAFPTENVVQNSKTIWAGFTVATMKMQKKQWFSLKRIKRTSWTMFALSFPLSSIPTQSSSETLTSSSTETCFFKIFFSVSLAEPSRSIFYSFFLQWWKMRSLSLQVKVLLQTLDNIKHISSFSTQTRQILVLFCRPDGCCDQSDSWVIKEKDSFQPLLFVYNSSPSLFCSSSFSFFQIGGFSHLAVSHSLANIQSKGV